MARLEDMTWRTYQNEVRARARELGVPVFGTFELTPLCNFSCKMCYVRLSFEQMRSIGRLHTAGEWLDIADQAVEAGTVGITLTGGEVLTRTDFPEIYEGLVDRGIFVSILSNGSLIDDSVVELFRNRPPAHMRFTLYGSSNDTYRRLCGVSDGFDRVWGGLRQLKDSGIGFSLAFTETVLNIDDFDGVVKCAEELDVPLIVGSSLVSGVRGAKNQAESLRVDRPRYREARAGAQAVDDPMPLQFDRSIRPDLHPFARCRSYRNSFWIDWNGTMEMCSFMSSCKARPFEDGFQVSWNDLLERLDRIHLPEGCATCTAKPFCFACPGVLAAETGSAEGKADWLCERARALEVRVLQAQEGDDGHEEAVRSPHDEGFCD